MDDGKLSFVWDWERSKKAFAGEKLLRMKALCHCLMISLFEGGGWIGYKYAIFDIFRNVCLSLSLYTYLQGYTLTFRSIKSIMMMRRAEAEWMDGKRGDKKEGKIELFSLSVVKFRMNEDFFSAIPIFSS